MKKIKKKQEAQLTPDAVPPTTTAKPSAQRDQPD
jgi:hypothetical protein